MVRGIGWLDGVGEVHVEFKEEEGYAVEDAGRDVGGIADEGYAVGV